MRTNSKKSTGFVSDAFPDSDTNPKHLIDFLLCPAWDQQYEIAPICWAELLPAAPSEAPWQVWELDGVDLFGFFSEMLFRQGSTEPDRVFSHPSQLMF